MTHDQETRRAIEGILGATSLDEALRIAGLTAKELEKGLSAMPPKLARDVRTQVLPRLQPTVPWEPPPQVESGPDDPGLLTREPDESGRDLVSVSVGTGEVLLCGIDLGTSNTVLRTSSGALECIPSAVGYSKAVDYRTDGTSPPKAFFGEEALAWGESLSLYRPLEFLETGGQRTKGTEFATNMRAARDLLAEAVGRVKVRRDVRVHAVLCTPTGASQAASDEIRRMARGMVDSLFLCTEPFSVAYGMDMLDDVLVVDVGAATTDLCRMQGIMPGEDDTLTLRGGEDEVDRDFAQRVMGSHPGVQLTLAMASEIRRRFAESLAVDSDAVVSLPVDGSPVELNVAPLLRLAYLRILGPIVEGLSQLTSSADPEFRKRLLSRVLLAGGGSQVAGLEKALEAALRRKLGAGSVLRVEDPERGGADGALKIARDMPAESWNALR